VVPGKGDTIAAFRWQNSFRRELLPHQGSSGEGVKGKGFKGSRVRDKGEKDEWVKG
jgi:hypothetical protein